MLKKREIDGLLWNPSWDCHWDPVWEPLFGLLMEDEIPTLDELLQMIDQPKSPRLYRALGALGMSYVKETA